MSTRNLIAVPGIDKVSEAFKDKVIQVATRLATEANFLMAVMSFETGGSFSPSQKNFAGSGAVGLIQFMPRTAEGLGTSTAALARMTAEQQLDFVEKYLRPFKGRLRTIEDTYMAVLFPKAIGKDNNFVLFREGTTAFKQNKGLDVDGNGRITKHEAAQKVRERLHVPASPPVPNPEVSATVTIFNTPLSQGDKGPAVKHLQDRLVALGFMTQQQVQTGPGVFGPKTREALRAFQQDHGLEPSGVLTLDTAQVLLNAVPDVTVGRSSTAVEALLPAAGPGFETYLRGANGRHQFGRAATITALRALGEAWFPLHPEIPFQVGHISLKGGGDFPPHKSHRTGNDVDVRPLRTDGLLSPVTIDDAMYSHTLTREFVQLVKQRHPDTTIFFNDRRLVGSMTQAATGHHNHLHLRFRHAA